MWLNRQGKKTVATNAEAVAQVEKTDGRKQRSVRSRDRIKSSIITSVSYTHLTLPTNREV